MRYQRGNIYFYIAGVLAFLGLMWGVIHAWHSYTAGLDKAGYDRGVAETTAAFQKRDNAQLQAALAAKDAAEMRAAKLEQDAATAQSNASKAYAKGVKDGKAATDARIADIHSGKLGLRDPGSKAGACPPSSSEAGKAETNGPTSGSDASAGTELSGQASEFLLNLTGEADEVVKQLAAAQAVIVLDRALCNAP